MSYIGIFGARRLDIKDPSRGLTTAHKVAVEMIKEHESMNVIKEMTGWEMGVDGKWRFELDDPFHTTPEIEDHLKKHFGEPINIKHCMNNIELIVAYPNFERLRLFGMYSPTRRFAGYFNPSNYGMIICMGTSTSPFEFQVEGVILHEVQHLIQEEENFARGGSTSMGRNRYIRLAGEVEARNICIRHSLSKEERVKKLRSETQDVPDNRQIIIF